MSEEQRGPVPGDDRRRGRGRYVRNQIIIWVVVAVVVVVLAFVLASVVPTWWAQRMGDLSDGSIFRSGMWGVLFGVVFTAVPLMILLRTVRRWKGWKLPLTFIVLAVITALPNLFTAWIVWGTSRTAHRAERTLDVDAPYFTAATLWGVVLGVVVAVGLELLWRSWRRRGKRLKTLKGADAGIGEHGEALRPLPPTD